MQIVTCPPYEAAIRLAKARLGSSGVIVYPTDTVYGIGCDALDAGAIARLREIKRREAAKPLSVNFASWKQASSFVEADSTLLKKLGEITPGPFTFLLAIKEKMPVTNEMVLGCRVPDSEFCRRIGEAYENPIVSTSANVSGGRSPASVEEMDGGLLGSVDLIVDGGPTKQMEGSTIIDVLNRRILRRGAGLERAQKWLSEL